MAPRCCSSFDRWLSGSAEVERDAPGVRRGSGRAIASCRSPPVWRQRQYQRAAGAPNGGNGVAGAVSRLADRLGIV